MEIYLIIFVIVWIVCTVEGLIYTKDDPLTASGIGFMAALGWPIVLSIVVVAKLGEYIAKKIKKDEQ